MLASTSLGEDAALLDLLVEAAQGALERLVLPYSDFSQSVFTSSDQDLEALLRRGRPTEKGDSTDWPQSRRSLPEGSGRVKRPLGQSTNRKPAMTAPRSTTSSAEVWIPGRGGRNLPPASRDLLPASHDLLPEKG